MASIEEIMKSVNKTSLFGHLSPDYIQTVKSERQEQERRMRQQKKQRDEEHRKLQEEEERKQREDDEFASREYEEYVKKYENRGIFQRENRILQNEPHVRHFINHGGESGIYSNKVQSEIWQPGPSNKYTQFEKYASPNFTFKPVSEHSPAESPVLPYPPIKSPDVSIEDFPNFTEIAPPTDTVKTPLAASKPRRSRVAANFTNKAPEGVGEASTTRRLSWRDAPSTVSVCDLRPDRRVIRQINTHLSSARDEFKLCKDDFPPISKGRKN